MTTNDDATRTAAFTEVGETMPTAVPPVSQAEGGTLVQSPTDAARIPVSGPELPTVRVPGYEVLGELGSGGMGIVYRARDERLNRPVALKMVLRGRGGETNLLRFRLEAEAMAAVRHPHVAQVFEAGETGDGPFLAMEYLPQGTLTDAFQARGPLPPVEAAELVGKVASGTAAAHRQGIVHRDLKPSNVLFDASGEPKVTDFGLAKLSCATDLTVSGAVIGTPAYMAPEQAGGGAKFVGPAADVWSLGVILYEAVTGKRPFDGPTAQAVLSNVTTVTPSAPRKVVPTVPRDLELICLKCLEKQPHERYPTAKELAEDLDRYRRGEPISVRPSGPVERALKWARRNPTAATAYVLGAVAVVLLAFGGTVAWLWRDAVAAHGQAEIALEGERAARAIADRESSNALAARDEATAARDQLRVALTGEKTAREVAEEALGGQRDARSVAERALSGERAALQRLELQQYARAVDLAHREWQAGNVARARSLLASCKPGDRGWEWEFVHRLCHSDVLTLTPKTALPTPSGISAVEFDPTGERLLVAHFDGYGIWDLKTGSMLASRPSREVGVRTARFSPDGKLVAVVRGLLVTVWDHAGNQIVSELRANTVVRDCRFSADGKRLLVLTEGAPELRDPETGNSFGPLDGHTGQVVAASFTPNGRQVVTAGIDGTVRVWDAKERKELQVLVKDAGHPDALAISPDGKRVAVAFHNDSSIRVWELGTGKALGRFTGHQRQVARIEFVQSGEIVGSADWSGRAFVWSVADGRLLDEQFGTAGQDAPLFNLPRWQFLTFGSNNGLQIAELGLSRAGLSPTVLRGDQGELLALARSPTGRFLATGGRDGIVRVWDPDRSPAQVRFGRPGMTVASVDFSADGRFFATAGSAGLRVLRSDDQVPVATIPIGTGAPPSGVRFNAAGTDLLTIHGQPEYCLKLWKVGETKPTHVFTSPAVAGKSRGVWVTEFSRDGTRVAVAWAQSPEVDSYEVATGKKIRSVTHPDERVTFVADTADGKLVTGSPFAVCVWDADGRQLHRFGGAGLLSRERLPMGMRGIAVHPDGRRAVALVYPNRLATFDLATGAVRFDPFDIDESGSTMAFSPDGSRLLVGGRAVRVFDFATREELVTLGLDGREGVPHGVRFSADGTRAIAERGHSVVVWDARPVNPAFVRLPLAPLPKPKP